MYKPGIAQFWGYHLPDGVIGIKSLICQDGVGNSSVVQFVDCSSEPPVRVEIDYLNGRAEKSKGKELNDDSS